MIVEEAGTALSLHSEESQKYCQDNIRDSLITTRKHSRSAFDDSLPLTKYARQMSCPDSELNTIGEERKFKCVR